MTGASRLWRPISRHVAIFLSVVLFGTCATVSAASATSKQPLWQEFRDGTAFAVMRHAIAPGTGDPGHFKINDCSTQRNLSAQGRAQARRAGELFRLNGLNKVLIYSSQWCRCRETAKLLAIGPVRDLASLNSFFEADRRRKKQTHQLKSWLQARVSRAPLLLVTHQVNISALIGSGTRSGEIVFIKPMRNGTYHVLSSSVP